MENDCINIFLVGHSKIYVQVYSILSLKVAVIMFYDLLHFNKFKCTILYYFRQNYKKKKSV